MFSFEYCTCQCLRWSLNLKERKKKKNSKTRVYLYSKYEIHMLTLSSVAMKNSIRHTYKSCGHTTLLFCTEIYRYAWQA